MSSEGLHAPREVLSQEARLLHNAITSLVEELEAVDWYRQRADVPAGRNWHDPANLAVAFAAGLFWPADLIAGLLLPR